MQSTLLYHIKRYFDDGSLQEIKIWSVPKSKDKPHGLKYSFAYIVSGERIICYDNAEGKNDHKHIRNCETPYKFISVDKLWSGFMEDITRFREGEL